jgi:hypothetical protein
MYICENLGVFTVNVAESCEILLGSKSAEYPPPCSSVKTVYIKDARFMCRGCRYFSGLFLPHAKVVFKYQFIWALCTGPCKEKFGECILLRN